MNNAKNISCDLLCYSKESRFDEKIRQFQGCPSIAITKKGRIFLAWYAGGTCEPHMDNYNLMVYSDDNGKSWSEPVLIIPSNKEKCIHALDIQLWSSPEGKLYIFWVQNNTRLSNGERPAHSENQPWCYVEGYEFGDFEHAEWLVVCEEPDAKELIFTEPRYLDKGFLRCKPLVLKSGRWINFNYDQISDRYGYSISEDRGMTYTHHYGAQKLTTRFDEAMAYEMKNGVIRMFARTRLGKIAESISVDEGITWQPAKLTGIDSPDTRFFISRTPTGRVLLINNDHSEERKNMTLYLSEDDGRTWKYKRCIDVRDSISYPDADFYNGKIYVTYDRERTGAKEILFLCFTEEDIMNTEYELEPQIVSKP